MPLWWLVLLYEEGSGWTKRSEGELIEASQVMHRQWLFATIFYCDQLHNTYKPLKVAQGRCEDGARRHPGVDMQLMREDAYVLLMVVDSLTDYEVE
ncbi:hypothetical protein COCOBI_04-1450 [Coccomyxa sp. Obi]|nr:hypothetical protein COCOBI_04-1450 [Coccomyxa sp. Obi]